MANAKVFEELKAALNGASASQLNSHSTLKAAEALLTCLRYPSPSSHCGSHCHEVLQSSPTPSACPDRVCCHSSRDGVAGGGGAYAPVGASGAPSLHYGMSYVDGSAPPRYPSSEHHLPFLCNKASAGHVNAHGVNTHGYSAKAVATEKGRSTEGVMKGSSWSSNY
eukprot:1183324-Rhodomonas_salina.5